MVRPHALIFSLFCVTAVPKALASDLAPGESTIDMQVGLYEGTYKSLFGSDAHCTLEIQGRKTQTGVRYTYHVTPVHWVPDNGFERWKGVEDVTGKEVRVMHIPGRTFSNADTYWERSVRFEDWHAAMELQLSWTGEITRMSMEIDNPSWLPFAASKHGPCTGMQRVLSL